MSQTSADQRWWSTSLAAGGAALGLGVHLALLSSARLGFNADEAVTGIMAREALRTGPRLVLAAANYTAPVETWVYAPLQAVFGPSVPLLRAISVLGWLIGALVVGKIGSLVASPRAAAAMASTIWVTPGALGIIATRAYMAYPSGLALTAATLLAAVRFAQEPVPGHRAGFRLGVTAGVTFWVHPMFLAVTLPAVIAAAVVQRRQRLGSTLAILGGGVVGGAPYLAWNVAHRFASLTEGAPPGEQTSMAERLERHVVGLYPRALGLRSETGEWIFGRFLGLTLYGGLAVAMVLGIVKLLRDRTPAGRVIAVCALTAPLLLAAMDATYYVIDGRYAIGPFVPFTMCAVIGLRHAGVTLRWWRRPAELRRDRGHLTCVVMLGLLGTLSVPYAYRLVGLDSGSAVDAEQALLRRLHESGVRQVMGTYWAVNPLDMVSAGEVTGPIVEGSLNRFPATQRLAPTTTPDQLALVYLYSEDPGSERIAAVYRWRETYGPYVVYLPVEGR